MVYHIKRLTALLLAVLILFALPGCGVSRAGYEKASALMKEGDYASAKEAFLALGDYEDSADKAKECENAVSYDAALGLMESGDYESAYNAFIALSGYQSSAAYAEGCKEALRRAAYDDAMELYESCDYEKAAAAFRELGSYSDSEAKLIDALLSDAESKFIALDFKGSNKLFVELSRLGVTDMRLTVTDMESAYAYALTQQEMGNDPEALELFTLIGTYKDSAQRAEVSRKNIEGWPIAELTESGSVIVDISTQYIDFATLFITNNTDKVLHVVIPFGTWLSSKSKSVQNMLITSEHSCTLDPKFSASITVDTACMNLHRDIPELGDGYEIKALAEDDPLRKLLPVLAENSCGYYVTQAAVWMITDDADYDDLGILINQYEERVINEQDYDIAVDMLQRAGIDN